MAKEFDIYLNNRLTQCDIIVYSIPRQIGITAMNHIILESCLDNYLLQKFVAAQTSSELVAHIDDMSACCVLYPEDVASAVVPTADVLNLDPALPIQPEHTTVELLADMRPIVMRHRLLGEMDESILGAFDGMTLEECGFVILQ